MKSNILKYSVLALSGKVLTLAIMLAFTHSAQADTVLNVWLQAGGVQNYSFASTLKMTATSATELTLTSDDVEVVYPIENIKKLTLNDPKAKEIETAISAPSASGPTSVGVYNMSGVLVRTLTTDAQSVTHVDLDGLPAGIYIVKSASTQFKIRVK